MISVRGRYNVTLPRQAIAETATRNALVRVLVGRMRHAATDLDFVDGALRARLPALHVDRRNKLDF